MMSSVTPLNHVLEVLGEEIYVLIFQEAGIQVIEDLWFCDLEELKNLSVITGTENLVTSLNLVQLGKLRRLLTWFEEKDTEDMNVWFQLTINDLKKTRFIKPKSTNVTIPEYSGTTSSIGILAGVKRDLSVYPKLQDDKMWLSYNRTILALAASHDLSEIFIPTFKPSPEESAEFKRKNIFVYSMFTYSLITAKAKVALRAHGATLDAQKVYSDLLAAYSDGTTAHISADALETQL